MHEAWRVNGLIFSSFDIYMVQPRFVGAEKRPNRPWEAIMPAWPLNYNKGVCGFQGRGSGIEKPVSLSVPRAGAR